MKTRTITFTGSGSFGDALALFKEMHPRFVVERTGYTAKFKLPDGQRYMFAEQPMRPSLFPIARKLKEEVVERGIPQVDESAVRYFGFARIRALPEPPARAWCVDLSSAYAYALKKRGLLSDELFDKINALPKLDRLRVIGMLATTKTVLDYANGEVLSVDTKASDTRPAFFAACETVGRLMQDVEGHPAHLFYWVDGAFFDRPVPEVKEYFEEQGFPCKVEEITDLRWSRKRGFLFYRKDGALKYLSLPSGKKPNPAWIAALLNK